MRATATVPTATATVSAAATGSAPAPDAPAAERPGAPTLTGGPSKESGPSTEGGPTQASTPTTADAPAGDRAAAQESGSAERQPSGAEPASGRRGRRLVGPVVFGVVVVALLAAIGYLVYHRFYGDPTKGAAAGDCLADLPIVAVGEDQEVGPARVVACTDPGATYVVEGRLDRLTEAQASSPTICQAYENATFIYRAVPRGGTGYVLCLRALNP